MEVVLLKLARQLDSLDEASLLMLWEDYAQRVANFEPTKRWEEAVLVLSLIQAKHWKNQLFNQQFSAHVRPEFQGKTQQRPFDFSLEKQRVPEHRAAILQFSARGDTTSVESSSESVGETAPSAGTDSPAQNDPDHKPNSN